MIAIWIFRYDTYSILKYGAILRKGAQCTSWGWSPSDMIPIVFWNTGLYSGKGHSVRAEAEALQIRTYLSTTLTHRHASDHSLSESTGPHIPAIILRHSLCYICSQLYDKDLQSVSVKFSTLQISFGWVIIGGRATRWTRLSFTFMPLALHYAKAHFIVSSFPSILTMFIGLLSRLIQQTKAFPMLTPLAGVGLTKTLIPYIVGWAIMVLPNSTTWPHSSMVNSVTHSCAVLQL